MEPGKIIEKSEVIKRIREDDTTRLLEAEIMAHEDFLYPIPQENIELANNLSAGIVWENYMDSDEGEPEVYMPMESVMYLKSTWGKESDDTEEKEFFIEDINTYFKIQNEKSPIIYGKEIDWQMLENYFSDLSINYKNGLERETFSDFEKRELANIEIPSFMYPIPRKKAELAEELITGISWDLFHGDGEEDFLSIEEVMFVKSDVSDEIHKDIDTYFKIYDDTYMETLEQMSVPPEKMTEMLTLYFSELVEKADIEDFERPSFSEYIKGKNNQIKSVIPKIEDNTETQIQKL